MDKKLVCNISNRNLAFWVLAIFTTLTFMMQICSALTEIKGGGVLNGVKYNIFELEISVTMNTYSNVYSIYNYPLIPIVAGLIYNAWISIKNSKVKEKTNLL